MKNLLDNVHDRVYNDMRICLNKNQLGLLFFSPTLTIFIASKVDEAFKQYYTLSDME